MVSSAPTPAAPSTSPATPRQLVIALDNSSESIKAVSWTLQHVYREGDIIHLLTVIPRPFVATSYPTPALLSTAADADLEAREVEGHFREFLERHVAGMMNAAGAKFEVHIVHGKCKDSISHIICTFSEQVAANLVVLFAKRKSMLEHLFLGSVSKQVVADCKQPTMLLHD